MTNDDGIESVGLHVLARALVGAGHDVVVVAPNSDRSGTGAALGLVHADQHLDAQRVEIPDLDAPAFALDGPPGLCTVAARLEAFGPSPEVVVSGINAGLNTGRAVLHSGTVGAALTGQNFGISGLAVSVASAADGTWCWDTAAHFAVDALALLPTAPPRTVLNLNVPGRRIDEVLGVRWARLAVFGAVRSAVRAVGDGRYQFELVPTDDVPPPDSDQALVRAGYATLTTLVGIAEAWPPGDGAVPDVHVGVRPGAPLEAVHAVPDASAPRSLVRPMGVEPDR